MLEFRQTNLPFRKFLDTLKEKGIQVFYADGTIFVYGELTEEEKQDLEAFKPVLRDFLRKSPLWFF